MQIQHKRTNLWVITNTTRNISDLTVLLFMFEVLNKKYYNNKALIKLAPDAYSLDGTRLINDVAILTDVNPLYFTSCTDEVSSFNMKNASYEVLPKYINEYKNNRDMVINKYGINNILSNQYLDIS